MERSSNATMVSFLLGGLVGAGVALLFAPQSGGELRGRIGESVREGADRGRQLTDQALAKGRTLVDDARQGVQWQRDRLAAAIEAGRDAYREEKAMGTLPSEPQA
jgi:gas vesicle protein